MKLIIVACLFLVGCTNKETEQLRHRTLTDTRGCKYRVEPGMGDTVFLYQLVEDNPHCEEPFK